jgi:hypothetical protein
MRRGLSIIGARSESLSRFMQAYARLARLPPPRYAPVEVGELVRRVAALETRLSVEVSDGARVLIEADADQLEQLLINLIRNAADAALQTGGAVRVSWSRVNSHLDLIVEDEGQGLPNTSSSRSSRPSPAARGSDSCSVARSPKRTAARSASTTARKARAASHASASHSRRPATAIITIGSDKISYVILTPKN